MDSPREIEDEEEEEEINWLGRDVAPGAPSGQHAARFPRNLGTSSAEDRVIIHVDMDCFYAQVEMIRNPELRDKPLGVQQKFIVVTCNYEARRQGVTKLMLIRDAKEKCPDLVLVSGEDLTPYREMSYRITELLEEFSPKVERLGFDENFIDVTELVDKKLQQEPLNKSNLEVSVCGHVYNDQIVNMEDRAHVQLAIGSQIAAEIRAALCNRLGVTSCAGIASSKLLSKLVSGTFKPNQQTVLFPENSSHLINGLKHVNKVPGIGYKTSQRLESLNLSHIQDLQSCPLSVLEKEFGRSAALRMQMLSRGEDNSPVTPSGPPQSLSDEDSFKKCSTVLEVKTKIKELLSSLLDRLSKDGRIPHTLRLTIRQFHPTNKWFNRESRQCAIPNHVIQNMGAESDGPAAPLMELLMKLFEKMINVKMPFHLTLLNVCFSNLKPSTSSRNLIGFYLNQKTQSKNSLRRKETNTDGALNLNKNPRAFSEVDHGVGEDCPPSKEVYKTRPVSLPEDIDMDVLSQLPEDIRNEILRSPQAHKTSQTGHSVLPSKGILNFFSKVKPDDPSTSATIGKSLAKEHPRVFFNNQVAVTQQSSSNSSSSDRAQHENTKVNDSRAGESMDTCTSNTYGRSAGTCTLSTSYTDVVAEMDCTESGSGAPSLFPKSVDQKVFSELPLELQKELLTEWKQQSHTSKIKAQNRKPQEKSKVVKGRKTPVSKPPSSVLKYFKPS